MSGIGSVAIRVALLAAALWALGRELDGLTAAELVAQLAGYGWRHVWVGLGATGASFLILGVVEVAAVRATGGTASDRLPRRRIVATSFVANAVSQSVGLALLTGAAIRVRAYKRRGVDAATAMRVTGFVTVTATLGLVATGAVALMASREPLRMHGSTLAVQPAGAVLALLPLGYLAWSLTATRATFGRGAWQLPRPSFALASAQLCLSSLDWLLSGAVLVAFLPAGGIGFWTGLRVYLIAQLVGVTSHVPGSAGVLEVVVLALVGSSAPPSDRPSLVAALVMFRAIYYLLPLVVALAVAGAAELREAARLPDLAPKSAGAG